MPFGIIPKYAFTGIQSGVYENWLTAAPVVALGAPLGVFIVARIGRKPTLLFVAVLCIGQFLWTLRQELDRIGWIGAGLCVLAVGLFNVGFEWLWRFGDRLKRRSAEFRTFTTTSN